ncbi:hypothetical protein PVL29_000422 [Vitis rotundifolia]|uniref:Uncharacterized protein n=1 Tax=Vitis rotundifolia TaxID=103349 RepID=A0AA39E4Q6_VITRO|nr:hypothetical protein PVL29_000422 [Vitis rotundifolia]
MMVMEKILLFHLPSLALLGGVVEATWSDDRLIKISMLKMFVDELPDMPKILGFEVVNGVPVSKSLQIGFFFFFFFLGFLLLSNFFSKFHRDLPPTRVFAYGTSNNTATVPGPTIEALYGVDTYKGVPTVVHLHGGMDEPQSDRNANSWFTRGFRERGPAWTQKKYHYYNIQQPGNM